MPRVVGAVVLVALAASSAGAASSDAAGPRVDHTGGHTATPLADGRVLVVGRVAVSLFDPRTGSWANQAAPATPRTGHTATLLRDGRVLVAGGYDGGSAKGTSSAEVFDLVTGWAPTAPMSLARFAHTATLLTDGTVLVAGGLEAGHGPFPAEAERYDPASGSWRPAGAMDLGRAYHTATLLTDGFVFVAGGQGAAHAESLRDGSVYDPSAGTWTASARLMTVGRALHTATLLPEGTVLVAGGTRRRHGQRQGDVEASAELYDPRARSFLPAPSLGVPRVGHTATSLGDRGVLVMGEGGPLGTDETVTGQAAARASSVELYDPATRAWRTMPTTATAPGLHTATLLAQGCGRRCGKVLVVGAAGSQLYTPPGGVADASAGDGGGRAVPLGAVGAGVAVVVVVGLLTVRARRARRP